MATAATASTVPKQLTPWKPGQSGNPAGRKPGSRNKLGEDFIAALHESFQANGEEAIQEVFEKDKVAYLKVIASVIPKEVIHTPGGLEDVDDELLERLFIDAALRAAGIDPDRIRKGTKALPAPMSDEPPLAAGSRSGSEGL